MPQLGVSTGGAGAIAGMKTGAKIGSKIGKYPGNLTGSAAENAGKVIKVMTMDFDPIASGRKVKNIASDGIKKFMSNKKNDTKDTEENKSQETENTKIQETKNSNSETFSESEMRREKDSKE